MKQPKQMTGAILGTVLALLVSAWNIEAALVTAAPVKSAEKTKVAYTRSEIVTSSEQAMQLLTEGNKRFTEGKVLEKDVSKERRTKLSQFGQKPFAVIISCSDSRIPPELIFDQALGDLFVVRVAGNVVDAIEMGSVEYAVEHLSTPLVVVMGHEKCGAVQASLDGGEVTDNIAVIAGKIKPAIEAVKSGRSHHAKENNIYEAVTDENVEEVVKTLKHNPVIHHLMEQNKVEVVGAKYHQESGTVEFFQTTEHGH